METSQTAAATFRKVLSKPNFMTPNLIGHYAIKNGAAELTSGEFMRTKIFGVTVVRNGKHDTEACKSFRDITEATMYIKELKG